MAIKKAEQVPEEIVRPNIKDVFRPSSELEIIQGLKIGVFGRAKVGKTHFAMTAPLPIYIVDTEGSAKLNRLQFPKDRQDQMFIAEVIRYAEKQDSTDSKKKVNLVASLNALLDAVDLITNYIRDNPDLSGTVVIDSASDVWDWMNVWMDENAARTSAGNIARLEWGKVNKIYAQFMYMLLTSGWNVIMTFRAEPAVNDKGQDLGYDKAKWQKKTDYWLDVILEMKLLGYDTVVYFVGDRLGRIQGELTNPKWDDIAKMVEEKSGIKMKR